MYIYLTFIYIKHMTSNLSKAHETCDSLSSFCLQIVLVYLQPSSQFTLIVYPTAKNHFKKLKPPYFEGSRSKVMQCHRLTPQKCWSPVFMISSMSVAICNHFHAGRANSNTTTFREYPFLTILMYQSRQRMDACF